MVLKWRKRKPVTERHYVCLECGYGDAIKPGEKFEGCKKCGSDRCIVTTTTDECGIIDIVAGRPSSSR